MTGLRAKDLEVICGRDPERSRRGEPGVPGTRGFRVLGCEPGVPGTRGFRVLGCEPAAEILSEVEGS